MILLNVNIIGKDGPWHIDVAGDKINKITGANLVTKNKNELSFEFDKVIAFPGLINSHDHLEFNLFPQLANKVYKNYMDWGVDIHKYNKEAIDSISRIPKPLRVQWGIYKNLLNGITTVIQHGEYFNIENRLIDIYQDCYSLHSVGIEKNWKFKLNNPFAKNQPYVIHVGEGTDTAANQEISELIKWNFLKRKLIAIHGVAMTMEQAKSFEALVWCPDSNFFLLNATAKVNELEKTTKILFGTDSTLSASWNVWEQIRLARRLNMLTDKKIFSSLTCEPATVWNLNESGILEEGKYADIVVAKLKDENNLMNSFFQLNPEDILIVMKKGKVILVDEMVCNQLNNFNEGDFCRIFINNACKYVCGDLTGLIKKIRKYSERVKFPVKIE